MVYNGLCIVLIQFLGFEMKFLLDFEVYSNQNDEL